MEKNIILIHAGLAVIFTLYLLIRLFLALFGLKDREYQEKIRAKFKKPDWVFSVLLVITGIYPMILVGGFELYHLIKTFGLVGILWASRYWYKMNFSLISFMSIAIAVAVSVASFRDQPKFPRSSSSFAADNPEIVALSKLEKGRLIFTSICSKCHGLDGKLGRFGAADLTQSKLNTEEKLAIVIDGSPLTVMRSFKNELNGNEIEAVVEYIEALE